MLVRQRTTARVTHTATAAGLRRAVHVRSASTATMAANSAAPMAISVICQPGIPPTTTVCTCTGSGAGRGRMTPGEHLQPAAGLKSHRRGHPRVL